MTRWLPHAIPVFLACFTVFQASPGRRDAPGFTAALEAWDRGAFVEALEQLRGLLPDADEQTFEAIAVLTGEMFETTELTTDGRNPAFVGPTGLVMYETGRSAEQATVRIVDPAANNRVVAEFAGGSPAASPDGARVAYVTRDSALAIRDVRNSSERRLTPPTARVASQPAWAHDGTTVYAVVTGAGADGQHSIVAFGLQDRQPRVVATIPVAAQYLRATTAPAGLLYSTRRVRRGPPPTHGLVNIETGETRAIEGATSDIALSADGRTIAYVGVDAGESKLFVYPWAAKPEALYTTTNRLDRPALSADGSRVAFQQMLREDWEIFVVERPSGTPRRLSREIQHDALPIFLGLDTVLAVKGEGRHRRSYLYHVDTGTARRFFHNNTVRTIAPEYQWQASADGTRVLIGADRDGDTVSPERGLYLVNLMRRISRDALMARLDAMLESERALRARAAVLTAPHAEAIREIVGDISISRIYGYERDLFAFDSKHISQPGNRLASEYLHAAYASFGYTPEYQWFSPRGALDGRSANVLATLKGTVHPDVIYVISSHYDSTAAGPGADDDTSGTAVLLETARVLARRPQPATIVFASMTGEEAGLLGSEEFARRTAEAGWKVAGALNNDMIGWANDHRLDNTIRYSNAGIRDVQHAAAMTFTNLVTYDSRYYQSTDAEALYEAWGDIIGGIGSYPVLGNPHYHQSHDVLETINHQLVTETAKTTAASIVMLANSPARIRDLRASRSGDAITLTWSPSPERDIRHYVVEWTGADGRQQRLDVTSPSATIRGAAAGTSVSVIAVNTRGIESWDRARVEVPAA